MNTTKLTDPVNANEGKPPVVRRTFQAFDEDGILKMTASAKTKEEAIQIACDIFGHVVTIWNFKFIP